MIRQLWHENSFLVKPTILLWLSRGLSHFNTGRLVVRTPYMKMQNILRQRKGIKVFLYLAKCCCSLFVDIYFVFPMIVQLANKCFSVDQLVPCSLSCSINFCELSKIFKADCLPTPHRKLAGCITARNGMNA